MFVNKCAVNHREENTAAFSFLLESHMTAEPAWNASEWKWILQSSAVCMCVREWWVVWVVDVILVVARENWKLSKAHFYYFQFSDVISHRKFVWYCTSDSVASVHEIFICYCLHSYESVLILFFNLLFWVWVGSWEFEVNFLTKAFSSNDLYHAVLLFMNPQLHRKQLSVKLFYLQADWMIDIT